MIDSLVLATIITVTVLAAGVPLDELNDRIRNGESLLDPAPLRRAGGDLHHGADRFPQPDVREDGGRDQGGRRRQTAHPIGYRRAFTRWLSTAFLWALFWVPGILDHLWPLRDPRNQTFHDKFARSVVVRT